MKVKSRTFQSIKNVYYSIIWQLVSIGLSYTCRYFFVRELSNEYLGIEGLFTNILTVFSLADLGIGSAIVYTLYKPISENNYIEIQRYMNFYRRCYFIVAFLILFAGLLMLPNLTFFITGNFSISGVELRFIFLLFVLDSAFSYLFVYKAQLLNATQESYIFNLFQMIGKVLSSALMIVLLIVTHNFVAYLIVKVFGRVFTNIILSAYTSKKYSYLNCLKGKKLSKNAKRNIYKNVTGLFLNQVGYVLINGTDNIILAKFVNITAVALYSNYLLIINSVLNLVGQIFNSIVGSVGNLAVEGNKDKLFLQFDRIHFINYLIASFFTLEIAMCINDFITISFGAGYVMSHMNVFLLIINLFLQMIKNVVGTFKYACGIYWQDKYCTILRAFINLVFSVMLAVKFGISGVFAGTLISDLLTTFWYQPYVTYKYAFEKPFILYFKDFSLYLLLTIMEITLSFFIVHLIQVENQGMHFLISGFVGVIVWAFLNIAIWKNHDRYYYLIMLLKRIKNRR